MSIKVPSASDVAKKWAGRAAGASGEYSKNAAAAASDWESGAKGGASNYKLGVSAGNIEARFSAGISKAGASKYARKVTDVGGSRYSDGVAHGEADMQNGISAVLGTISSVTLPPRRPRGDPANLQRVAAVATALSSKRLQQVAAGR